jgi:hypothetical protein
MPLPPAYSSACFDISIPQSGPYRERLFIILVFGMLYPTIIIASLCLPTWWAGFTSYGIRTYAVNAFVTKP